jgi:hypothetical protein
MRYTTREARATGRPRSRSFLLIISMQRQGKVGFAAAYKDDEVLAVSFRDKRLDKAMRKGDSMASAARRVGASRTRGCWSRSTTRARDDTSLLPLRCHLAAEQACR